MVDERYQVDNLDVVAHSIEHVISLQLAGSPELYQGCGGRTSRRITHAGDITITPAGESKHWRISGYVELLAVRLAPEFADEVLRATGVDPPALLHLRDVPWTRDARIEACARCAYDEHCHPAIGSALLVDAVARQLVLHLYRNYSADCPVQSDPAGKLPQYRLRQATEFIDDHLREDLKLEDISRALAMSPFHFAHLFRQATGLPPHRYVVERRIERAKLLLRSTRLPITEIAHQVGFENQSHFSTVFHRVAGMSPRRYRDSA